jgi:hypothetical protein
MRYQSGSTQKSEAPSPAKMEEMFAKFNAWKEKFRNNIVDMGGKLGEGKIVTADTVTDGPFTEIKEIIGGYMIIAAESIAQAVEVAQQSPGVFSGSSIEVREIHKQ